MELAPSLIAAGAWPYEKKGQVDSELDEILKEYWKTRIVPEPVSIFFKDHETAAQQDKGRIGT